ncbi:hypothetical protein AB0N17_46610, partial [Streptomyces sp. NPDC051133]
MSFASAAASWRRARSAASAARVSSAFGSMPGSAGRDVAKTGGCPVRSGRGGGPPYVAGFEAAGEIVAIGTDVVNPL